jgi:hypothetical membrane protein
MSLSPSVTRRRLFAGLGVTSTVLTLGGIFVAAALAPWFSVFRNALSDLGAVGVATAPVFNGALVLGGALGTGFVVGAWAETDNPVHAGGAFVLLLAMVFMALVGMFPIPSPVHAVVAVAFFVFATLGVFVWGAGDFVTGADGSRVRGAALVVAAVVHVASWFWWLLYGWGAPGIALPELAGSGMLALWALWVSADLWAGPPDTLML